MRTADDRNGELTIAARGRQGWTLHYLGTPRLVAMYSPSNDVRGFIFPDRDGDRLDMVRAEGSTRMRSARGGAGTDR